MTNPRLLVRSFNVGSASVSVMSIGDVTLPLAPAMGLQPDDLDSERPDLHVGDLRTQSVIPLQSAVIRSEFGTVLVDSGAYDIEPDSTYAVPGYEPPASQVECLGSVGIDVREIEHVVVTHRHWDHFNGLSLDGETPTFPNARHYVSAQDWITMRAALAVDGTREQRSLAPMVRDGLLDVIEGPREILPGIRVLPAPGETAGHQVVLVASGSPEEAFIALGDLYHHPCEFAHPTWMVSWADPTQTARSRDWVVEDAVRSGALLMASHIPSLGRLTGPPDAPVWEGVPMFGGAEPDPRGRGGDLT